MATWQAKVYGIQLRAIAIAVLCTTVQQGMAAGLASDNASDTAYDDQWQNGDNGGSGWGGGWILSPNGNTGNAGHFIFDSNQNGTNAGPGINTPVNRAWGLYSNSLATADGVRPFSGALSVGQTFSIDMDNGFIDGDGTNGTGPDGVVGFGLQNASGQNLWEMFFVGGNSNYTVNAVNPVGATPTFTDGGLHIEFTLDSATTYQAEVTRLSDNAVFNLSGSLLNQQGGQSIDRVRVFSFNAGTDDFGSFDTYFNSITIVPEPASGLLLLIGAIAMLRRRKR